MIKIFQKNAYSARIQYLNNGSITSVVGKTFIFIVKEFGDLYENDNKALIKKQFEIVSSADALKGIFFLNLDSTDTNIEPGKYKYQMSFFNGTTFDTITEDELTIKNNMVKDI